MFASTLQVYVLRKISQVQTLNRNSSLTSAKPKSKLASANFTNYSKRTNQQQVAMLVTARCIATMTSQQMHRQHLTIQCKIITICLVSSKQYFLFLIFHFIVGCLYLIYCKSPKNSTTIK